jgi:hypothetical protein
MKHLTLALIFFTVFGSHAQSVTPQKRSKWGLEVETFQPFYPTVHILRIQTTYTLTDESSKLRGDLILGGYLRPNVKHDVVEKINEYLLATGYRQYLWRGFHLEGKSNLGYAWGTKNLIDGKDYNNLSWFWEANTGYTFRLGNRFYCAAQFGILSKIMADIGPRGGKPDTFLHGNLLLGIRL